MNEAQQSFNQQVRRKNHKKLVHQNLKLIAQLKRLQVQIQILDNTHSQKRQDNQHLTSLKLETQSQERQIKQLKDLIENEKHANLKQNVMYIRKEEDELISLKKQLQNLTIQKGLVSNSHNDKVKKLTDNQPLQKHKQQMQNVWAKTKKQNRQLNLKMVQMQRQIRKYHNLKEMSKDSPAQGLNYKDSQLKMTISQIQRLNNQMKNIEAKWKTNINQLDKQYFINKNTLSSCQKAIEELQREEQVWKRRSNNLRGQKQLENDRARLSKITSIKTSEEPRISSVQHKKIRDFKRSLIDEENAKKVSRLAKLASSLSRAESSPNPPTSTKKSLDIKFNGLQIPVKQDARYKISKEISQKNIDSNKIQKKNSLKDQKNIKFDKGKTNESPRALVVKSEHQEAKNENEGISHRQKHRIKSNAAVHLAESLKRKAQEVKQLNQKLIIQQQNYEKGKNKNKKQRNKQAIKNQLSMPKPENNINIKVQNRNKKDNNREIQNSPQIKKQKNEKSIEAIQFVKVKSKQKLKINEQKNLIQQSKPRQKELVQDLQFNKKVEKKEKLPIKNSMKIMTKDLRISSNDEKPILLPSKSPKQSSPQKSNSPKNKNQQIMKIKNLQKSQIYQNQKSPHKSQKRESQINLQIQLQDLEEGKPKIIKRKRLAQANLVTTGTST